jgi:GNAT superfamily N-acetyltransferase
MRAQEFLIERKKSREDFEGMTIEMVENGHVLVINALDDWGNNVLGSVAFNIHDNNELDPQDLKVDERYQGQGIAKAMYDYAKSKGYKIHRSYDQTDAGAGFWNKHRGEDMRVWEQSGDKKSAVRRIQKMLNDRFNANLDVDGILGPLTQKSINRFMPSARPSSADEPNRITAVQGKKLKTNTVAEAFDRPYPVEFEHSEYGDVDALTRLPDGTYLSIMFNQESGHDGTRPSHYSVEFYRNNSQEVTGEGDAQRVFATVLAAIQQFVEKFQPGSMSFSASKEVDMDADYSGAKFNPESRAKLYNRMVQRYASAMGYSVKQQEGNGKVNYTLKRAAQDVAEGVETKVGRRNETRDWAWYSMGKDGKWKYGGAARTKQQAQAKAQQYSSKQGIAEEQLDELSFLGSQCTKDCSGHRAGYEWSKRKGLRQANSWSPSFNKGAGLAVAGK